MRSLFIACAAASVLAACRAAAAAGPSGDEVALVVNGEPVMRSAIEKLLEPARREKLSPQDLKRCQQQAVQNIITDMLLEQHLRRDGFKPTAAEVDAEIERRRRTYGSTAGPGSPGFEEALRRVGTSLAEMRARPDPRLRFSCLVRRGLTEKDVLRFYETEKDLWAEVRARHVLIAMRDPKTDEQKAGARARAEEIRSRILAGEDFAELARQFSACPSKASGGDLGFFPRHGKMVEPFAKAAFELEPNGVSPVVETQFGFHVIQVTEARKGDAPFAEVREHVADAAADKLGRELFGRICKEARIESPRPPGAPGVPAAGPESRRAPTPEAPASPPPAAK